MYEHGIKYMDRVTNLKKIRAEIQQGSNEIMWGRDSLFIMRKSI